MTQPALRTVRPIDPVLSNLSIGFKNDMFYWDMLAPPAVVDQPSGQYTIYNREYWFRHQDGADRGPTSPYTRIGWDVSFASFFVQEIGYEKQLADVVRSASQLREDLLVTDVALLTNQIQMELERRVIAETFNKDGVWAEDKVPTTKWDSSGSNPLDDMDSARRFIKRTTGQWPNTLIMGLDVWRNLRRHADLINSYQYVHGGLLTREQLQDILEIPTILVGDNSYTTTKEGQTDSTSNYTDFYGDHALLLCSAVPGMPIPNGAQTFMWDQAGNIPWAAQNYYEEATRSQVSRIFTFIDPKVVSSAHGYRFKTAVA